MKRLVIVGGGFAGFWSALSAVRQARALGQGEALAVTLVSRDGWLTNRPRLYQADLDTVRVSLTPYCAALGIELLQGEVTGIDPAARRVSVTNRPAPLGYDALVLAAGSHLRPPGIPGGERAFNVDTFAGATALQAQLEALAAGGWATEVAHGVVVVGAGLTGLELATALPGRLAALAPGRGDPAVHVVEQAPVLSFTVDAAGRDYILHRLAELGVRLHIGAGMAAIEEGAAVLSSGERIATDTVIWTGGLEASSLTAQFGGPRDDQGRLEVDRFLALPGRPEVFVAGDAAQARADEGYLALMSCQHAIPQGRFAGHNAACRLLGAEPMAYSQPDYRTCLDLGPGAALTTTGWERRFNKSGPEGKAVKDFIVHELIVPPADVDAALRDSAPAHP